MAYPGAGIGDLGGGFGGFPGAGIGGGLNLDVGGGVGLPVLGLLGGGLPGWAGFSGPYIPSTPLGALAGIKGDLIIPIVAVGVALFLLVLIVLAVKAALAWKLSLLSDVAGPRKWKRDIGSAPAPHLDDDRMMEMARMVMAAIYSDSCSKRVICDMGSYARSTKQLPAVLRLVESFIPSDYIPSLEIMRNSAEGSLECERQFPCGGSVNNATQQPMQDQPGSKNSTDTANMVKNQAQQQPQRQRRHVPVTSQQNPAQPQLPIPLQVTPRPTLLEGIKINNISATNVSAPEAVRPNVPKPTKFRPTN